MLNIGGYEVKSVRRNFEKSIIEGHPPYQRCKTEARTELLDTIHDA